MMGNFTPINFTSIDVDTVRKRAERHELFMNLFLLLLNITLMIIALSLAILIKKNLTG